MIIDTFLVVEEIKVGEVGAIVKVDVGTVVLLVVVVVVVRVGVWVVVSLFNVDELVKLSLNKDSTIGFVNVRDSFE